MLLQRGHSRKIFASHSTKKSFNYTVFIIRGITFKSSHSHKNDISVALPPSQVSFPVMGLGKWPCPRCAPWAFSSCFLPVLSCGGETESSWVGAGWWPRLTHSNQSGPICRKRNLFPKREASRAWFVLFWQCRDSVLGSLTLKVHAPGADSAFVWLYS